MAERNLDAAPLDVARARSFIDGEWQDAILPALVEYVRIPNVSPAFDRDWAAHGHMDRALALAEAWARRSAPAGASIEVVRLDERTPVLLVDVPGTVAGDVLLYGHLDKQPEMVGWAEGLGPWTPVVREERLYGRGAADDGYAVFASLTAIRALQEQGVPHPHCVVLIECSEESGSIDLPAHIEHLGARLGSPSLVVCLDSGCGDYDRLWCTTSLRGLLAVDLGVEVLEEGVHSGDAGGVVPSSFRIARLLLERLEDATTGRVRLPELHADIPADRRAQAEVAAEALGPTAFQRFPFVPGAGTAKRDMVDLVLDRTWRPAIEVIAARGIPALEDAGNVLRPRTTLRLGVRLPPTVPSARAAAAVRAALERDPPHGARVRVSAGGQTGWSAPPMAPWLEEKLRAASTTWFGPPPVAMGEGGSIPFMGMLGERFPAAQFVITGVLGPGSNAHGPNEFLDLRTARRLTGCIAQVLATPRSGPPPAA
ncbi:MAG: M20/M25/M40 family metallo-hydrolase [Deltaproteobacteria bacterium]|nr:M20/M25/M40 family metallo-hydrolase [Deltaproteobacteria bacterium]